MKVYRYENKYDGGGPWFSREGTSRNVPNVFGYTEIELSACISLQKLKEYFERELPEIFKNPDYQIVEYIIPDLCVISGHSHIYINTKDVISFQPVSTISNESRIEISKAKDTER